jgi:hypothetical protein
MVVFFGGVGIFWGIGPESERCSHSTAPFARPKDRLRLHPHHISSEVERCLADIDRTSQPRCCVDLFQI